MIGVVLAAAGSGSRFGSRIPKQFVLLGGKPVYLHTLECLSAFFFRCVLVLPEDWRAEVEDQIRSLPYREKLILEKGGPQRQDSVYNGLRCLSDEIEIVLVHDAARPFVSPELIERVIEGTRQHGACIPALTVQDTVKEIREGQVVGTFDRQQLQLAQTPQGFRANLLKRAFEGAAEEGFYGTDEALLVERLGFPVHVVKGEEQNRKITCKEDLRGQTLRSHPVLKYRLGMGYDFHCFQEGRKLVLGGVAIPSQRGLKGHSDADAVLHAVADALLGAAGLKDLGSYFPDSDPKYRGISSLLILEKVYRLVRGRGFAPGNVDITVIAEEPKIGPHIEAMKASLGRVLYLEADQIGIKATTMEGKGPIGRGEGLAVHAVALLVEEE